jgi:fimbrial chaperone protein
MDKRTHNLEPNKTQKKPQGVRIAGLISKACIRRWLENYESVIAQDRPADAIPTNSGPKSYDGVSNTAINRIMLEAAIRDLPPVLKVCLELRWITQLKLTETLRKTGIPKTTYYRRCNKAVDFIYYHVNGMAAQLKDLVDSIILEK